MPVPFDCIEVGTGRAPEGNDGCVFFVRQATADAAANDWPGWKYHLHKLVPGVLANPDRIYGDLGRDGYDSACCYSGEIPHYYDDDGAEVPCSEKRFLVVYTEPTSGGMIVLDWGLRREDRSSPGDPVHWQTFGKGRIWPPP